MAASCTHFFKHTNENMTHFDQVTCWSLSSQYLVKFAGSLTSITYTPSFVQQYMLNENKDINNTEQNLLL